MRVLGVNLFLAQLGKKDFWRETVMNSNLVNTKVEVTSFVDYSKFGKRTITVEEYEKKFEEFHKAFEEWCKNYFTVYNPEMVKLFIKRINLLLKK